MGVTRTTGYVYFALLVYTQPFTRDRKSRLPNNAMQVPCALLLTNRPMRMLYMNTIQYSHAPTLLPNEKRPRIAYIRGIVNWGGGTKKRPYTFAHSTTSRAHMTRMSVDGRILGFDIRRLMKKWDEERHTKSRNSGKAIYS